MCSHRSGLNDCMHLDEGEGSNPRPGFHNGNRGFSARYPEGEPVRQSRILTGLLPPLPWLRVHAFGLRYSLKRMDTPKPVWRINRARWKRSKLMALAGCSNEIDSMQPMTPSDDNINEAWGRGQLRGLTGDRSRLMLLTLSR